MADGSGVKQFIGGLAEAGSEVIKETVDVGLKALEQGVQSAVGSPISPQQIQQQEIKDQKEKARIRKWIHDQEQEQARVRQINQQKEQQKLQSQQQEEQTEEIEEDQKKTKTSNPALDAVGKIEIKRGVGG